MLALVTIATGAWADNYNVRIGGVMITSDNYTDITAANGFTAVKSGTVTYSYKWKTLILENAVIETDGGTSSLRILDNDNFTLLLKGENKIIQKASSDNYAGIDALNLIIMGSSGSLTIESPNAHGIFIDEQKTLTIDNTTLTVQAGRTGITSWQQKKENLVINHANVSVTGAQGSICDLGSLTLTDCGIVSPSGAAFSGGAVKVNGTTVKDEIVIEAGVPINATYFPDSYFRSYISSTSANIDRNRNGFLSEDELERVTYLNVASKNISDLTGIEYFDKMTSLYCHNNKLTELDLKGCSELRSVQCNNNKLTLLKVPIWIESIQCNNNCIGFAAMQELTQSLPKVTGGVLIVIGSSTDQNICTEWMVEKANSKGWSVYTSGNQLYAGCGLPINEEVFPDKNFRNYVSENYDNDGDGYLSRTDLGSVENIDVRDKAINDLTGIGYFTELKQLICYNDFEESDTDNHLTTLDLSKNTKLKYVGCGQNHTLTSLNISNCTELENLHCANNKLTTLDVSNCPKLWRLHCNNNQLTSLNLSNNPLLSDLLCRTNNITWLILQNHPQLKNLTIDELPLRTLDLSGCTALDDLLIGGTQLTSLDISNNTALTRLHVGGNSKLQSLDLSNNTALKEFYWNNNTAMALPNLAKKRALKKLFIYDSSNLTSIVLPNLPALTYLAVYDNEKLTSLNVSHCTALDTLYCYRNKLMSLDVSSNPALTGLYCYQNKLTSFNLSNNTALQILFCDENELTSLDLTLNNALKYLDCSRCKISSLVLSQNAHNLQSIYCHSNRLSGGKAIDDMIASLPNRTNGYGNIYFIDKANYYGAEEHNHCSIEQVAAAREKKWILLENDQKNQWYSYYGSYAITGDVNGDNNVDISDVVALVNIILNDNSNFQAAADVNNDGGIDISDVVALVNIILGQ